MFRLCYLINNQFDLNNNIPNDVDSLERLFGSLLKTINGHVVLFIDGLNQLDEADRAHYLTWLPEQLNENVKIIASTLPGVAEMALQRKTNNTIQLSGLSDDERTEIIKTIPSVFCKTLDKGHITDLLAKKATKNPLYLKIVLEELRIFGSFDLLSKKLNSFPDNTVELFIQTIKRIEQDHPGNNNIVSRLFCLLESSRYGLTEAEISDLMREYDAENRSQIILRQIRDYIYKRGNVIDFFHRDISKAIRKYYLQNNAKHWHEELAKYFSEQPLYIEIPGESNEADKNKIHIPNVRKLVEQPWQQIKQDDNLASLEVTLTDLTFIEAKSRAGMVDELLADFTRAKKTCNTLPSKDLQQANQFVMSESDTLRVYPELTVQQALNRPNTDVMSKNAIKLTSLQNYERLYITWKNKPQYENPLQYSYSGSLHAISCVSVSIEAGIILYGTYYGELVLLDINSGQLIDEIKLDDQRISQCQISANGLWFAGVINQQEIRAYEFTKAHSFIKCNKHVCIFSSIIDQLIIDNTVNCLAVVTGLEVVTYKDMEIQAVLGNHSLKINQCAYSPNGERITTTSDDGYLREFNVKNGDLLWESDEHFDAVYSCCYSDDGNYLVSGSIDEIILWDIQSISILERCDLSGIVRSISLQGSWPDELSATIITDDRSVCIVRLVINYQVDERAKRRLKHMSLSEQLLDELSTFTTPVGSRNQFSELIKKKINSTNSIMDNIVVIARACSKLQIEQQWLWYSNHAVLSYSWTYTHCPIAVATTIENDILVLGVGESFVNKPRLNKYGLYSVTNTGKGLAAYGNTDGELILWDTIKDETEKYKTHHDVIYDCAYIPESSTLVTVGGDRGVVLRDIRSRKLISKFYDIHLSSVHSLSVSNCGRYFATGDDGGTIIFWDLLNNNHNKLNTKSSLPISQLQLTQDPRYLVYANATTVCIWDIQNNKPIKSFTHKSGSMRKILAASDNSFILVHSNGNIATLTTDIAKNNFSITQVGCCLEGHIVTDAAITDKIVAITTRGGYIFMFSSPAFNKLGTFPTGAPMSCISELSDDEFIAGDVNGLTYHVRCSGSLAQIELDQGAI